MINLDEIFAKYFTKEFEIKESKSSLLLDTIFEIYRNDCIGVYFDNGVNGSIVMMGLLKEIIGTNPTQQNVIFLTGNQEEAQVLNQARHFFNNRNIIKPISLKTVESSFEKDDHIFQDICLSKVQVREALSRNMDDASLKSSILIFDNTETLFRNTRRLEEEDHRSLLKWIQVFKSKGITVFLSIPKGRNSNLFYRHFFDVTIEVTNSIKRSEEYDLTITDGRKLLDSRITKTLKLDDDRDGKFILREYLEFDEEIVMAMILRKRNFSQEEIAAKLNLSQASVSRRLQQAEQAGLISKSGYKKITLTNKGESVVRNLANNLD